MCWRAPFRANKLFMDDKPFKRRSTCRLPPPLSLDFDKFFLSSFNTQEHLYLSKLSLLTEKVRFILFLLSPLFLSLSFYLKTSLFLDLFLLVSHNFSRNSGWVESPLLIKFADSGTITIKKSEKIYFRVLD